MNAAIDEISLKDAVSFVVDNRGRSAPLADKGIKLIATNCISNRQLYPTYEQVRFVSQETYDNWFRAHPEPRDIILTNKGSQNGAVCLVPDPVDFCIAQDMVALRADADIVDPLYLFAALRSPLVQSRIKSLNVDAVIPHFKKTDFDKLFIPLPDMQQQQRIGLTYFELSLKIELNQRMNETLEAMTRAIFRDWFIDFGPTRAKMEGRAPYLAPDIWSLFPDTINDAAGLPEGWHEEPLTHFMEIVGGGTPRTSEEAFWGGDIPWFSVTDTPFASDTYVFKTDKSITQAGLESSAARLIGAGETIISARGTVGNLARAGREMAFNQSCYGLRGANGYGNAFVFLAARHMVARLQSMAHGSVFSTITRQTFEGVSIAAPGARVAARLEQAVGRMFARIKSNVAETIQLADTRDFLLHKLMSGEVQIRDPEMRA